MKKIMISGSRTINDESLISEKLNSALAEYTDMILISGGAKGVDSLVKLGQNHIMSKFSNINPIGKGMAVVLVLCVTRAWLKPLI